MYLLAHLHAHLLSYVEVEVVLERQVVCVALEVFATMILEIRSLGQPCLQVLTLQFLGIVALSLEGHQVDLLVSRNEHQVIATTVVAIEVSAIQHRIR